MQSPHRREWFLEAEALRYGTDARWMRATMEFEAHRGHDVLEICGGIGTDLAQFALNGARVTDVDVSPGQLKLAKENFAARGLEGRFFIQDAESLVFDDNSFDLVYSNSVIHHTPNSSSGRSRDLPRAEPRRPRDRDGLRGKLDLLLAEFGVVDRHQRRPAAQVLDE